MLRKLLLILILLEVLGFFTASLLHLGITVFGYSEIHNPSEALTQGFIAILFVVCVLMISMEAKRSWILAVVSHLIALIGAIFGIIASLHNGFAITYNLFNGLRLVLLLIVGINLLTPRAKKELSQ